MHVVDCLTPRSFAQINLHVRWKSNLAIFLGQSEDMAINLG
jgi:hypothetical protein